MWPIFLKILSIIGIILACILGVVILLLLLILLCPITYKAEGSAHENKYTAKIKIKYLFGLVRAGFDYPEPGNFYAKAAWITLFDSSKTKSDDDNSEEDTEFESLDADSEDIPGNDKSSHVKENSVRKEKADTKNDSKKEKKSVENNKKKILNPIYHIKKTWENIRYKLIVKVQYIIKDIKYYYALWEHEDTKSLLKKLKKHGLKILKIIAPKKGKVNLVIGFETPDTTGKIYGVCCALFSRWPQTFNIIPDFENKIIDGCFNVSGYFNLFSIAIHALPILLSKKLRITKARFDAHGEKKEISKTKAQRKHEKILKDLEEEYS